MTSDEFRESYDRSCNVAKVKRSQLDGDIPWDLLQFSVSLVCDVCAFLSAVRGVGMPRCMKGQFRSANDLNSSSQSERRN